MEYRVLGPYQDRAHQMPCVIPWWQLEQGNCRNWNPRAAYLLAYSIHCRLETRSSYQHSRRQAAHERTAAPQPRGKRRPAPRKQTQGAWSWSGTSHSHFRAEQAARGYYLWRWRTRNFGGLPTTSLRRNWD